MFGREGDIKDRESDRNFFLREAVGSNSSAPGGGSPARAAAQIQAPLFLTAGEDDERCPPAQSEAMVKALKREGKVVEYLLMPNEGHGYYKQASREQLYTRMLDWFARHIGEDSKAQAAPAAAR